MALESSAVVSRPGAIRIFALRPAHVKAVLFMLQPAVFWPIWPWYTERMTDGSDEPWGLLALLTAMVVPLAAIRGRRCLFRYPLSALPFCFTLLYLIFFPAAPPLISAGFAVLAIGAFISSTCMGRMVHPGYWGLMLLSLPVLPTLQFYLGYPLRSATAAGAAVLLQAGGLAVAAQGTVLQYNGSSVWVDAPCSGIKMLWALAYLNCTLLCLRNCGVVRSYAAIGAAAAAVFAANVARTTFLFLIESKLVPAPPFVHSLLGVCCFLSAAAAVAAFAARPERRAARKTSWPRILSGSAAQRLLQRFRNSGGLILGSAVSSMAAAFIPFLLPELQATGVQPHFPGWPAVYSGLPLVKLELSTRELRFSRDFPGRISRFRAGRCEVAVRFVAAATRKLHPAADCLRGLGYRISPLPAQRDAQGRLQGCTLAERGDERLKVCELIEDANGKSWPDVSSWYWAALLGGSPAPWFAYTVASPADGAC